MSCDSTVESLDVGALVHVDFVRSYAVLETKSNDKKDMSNTDGSRLHAPTV
jgi:hypothetical protein